MVEAECIEIRKVFLGWFRADEEKKDEIWAEFEKHRAGCEDCRKWFSGFQKIMEGARELLEKALGESENL